MTGDENGCGIKGVFKRRGVDAAMLAVVLGVPGVPAFLSIGDKVDALTERLASQEIQIALAVADRKGESRLIDERITSLRQRVDELARRMRALELKRPDTGFVP